MVNEYEAFVLYNGIKLHFSSKKYDFTRYLGKSKSTTLPFYDKRTDKFLYQKLAKHSDPKGLLVANLIEYPKRWIGDILGAEGKATHDAWLKRTQSLSYNFSNEIEELKNPLGLNGALKVQPGEHLPLAIAQYLRYKISPETLVIISELTGCKKQWDRKLSDDLLYKDKVGLLINKYPTFLHFDKDKFGKLLLEAV